MIVDIPFGIREDGVKLIKWFDGELVGYAENGKPIYKPRGYKIRKIGTNEIYNEAVDIETAPYFYEETDEPIEVLEEVPTEENLTEGDLLNE
jgi:hypothetical protein